MALFQHFHLETNFRKENKKLVKSRKNYELGKQKSRLSDYLLRILAFSKLKKTKYVRCLLRTKGKQETRQTTTNSKLQSILIINCLRKITNPGIHINCIC